MRKFVLLGLSLAFLNTPALAQTADQTQGETEGEALQRELEEKAIRIPESGLAAALKAREDGRSERALTERRLPDWEEVREELARTSDEDATRDTTTQNNEIILSAPNALLPPPPGIRAFAAERLPRTDRPEVDRVAMPVLAPAHPDIRNKIKVYGLDNAYTASAAIDQGANLSISGTCDRVIGGPPPVKDVRRRLALARPILSGILAPFDISRSEFSTDLSFSKFGCGYVISIECTNTANDTRCSGDDYIMMMARSMLLINPERAGE